jgi:tRNA (guanine37-N1)-methyltransferase
LYRLKPMTFHIITIFPEIFESYFKYGVLGHAIKKKITKIKIYNLRDFTDDKRRTVDDTVYGGGAGMLLKVEPILWCVENIKKKIKNKKRKARIILFSAKGKQYEQFHVKRLKKYSDIILICGRYEGVDERVAKYVADEEISIGEYVLTGGEIPAMVLVDSISRLLPGVLGNTGSSEFESFEKKGYLEHPHYTKPAEFQTWKVPKVLLSGNHKEIENWREKNSKISKSAQCEKK